MKLLALETATSMGSAALLEDDQSVRILAQTALRARQSHSKLLLPMIEGLLAQSGVTLSQIDAFAVSTGPGSFTGLRVGLSTVKAFGSVFNRKVIGVSTLEAMGWAAALHAGLICTVLNAGQRELYAAVFQAQDGRITMRWLKDTIVSPSALLEFLYGRWQEAETASPVLVSGDILTAHQRFFEKVDFCRWAPHHLSSPQALFVGQMAIQKMKGGKGMRPDELAPHYIRLPSAQACHPERRRREGSPARTGGLTP